MSRFTYEDKNFYLDGKRIVIRSGAIHYFRIPKEYWYDRLLKLKECGLNCVETYVAWNLHEPYENEFDFSGNLNLGEYIDIAKNLGLLMIIRPGPYICAEWEAGGFPFWLKNYPLHIRCSDSLYLDKVKNYLLHVFEIIKPRLIDNGGNIIMLQIENEYGSFGNDQNYLQLLKNIYEEILGKCLLFTSDSPDKLCLHGGTLPNVLAFINFGSHTKENFNILEKIRPNQPLMCMEFWCGWFDYWGGEHHVRSVEDKLRELNVFIENDYSFNIYMFCGGTNFGFMNGANLTSDAYQPTVTSYDYDGILTETGDRTEAYYKLRRMIQNRTKEQFSLIATDGKKKNYGKVNFYEVADLFDNLEVIGISRFSPVPLSMEEMGEGYGYILYKTFLTDVETLFFDEIHDRAIIFCDGKKVGDFERSDLARIEKIQRKKGKCEIAILVENMGRINFGLQLFDRKGIGSIRQWNQHVFGYQCIALPMKNLSPLRFVKMRRESCENPAFYRGIFFVDDPQDTFLKLEGAKRGFAVINGFRLGRYCMEKGPQRTLYVPASFLKRGNNELVVFDSDGTKSLLAELVAEPIL